MTKHRKHASETDTNRSFMVCLSLKTVLVLNIKRASAERVFKRSTARRRRVLIFRSLGMDAMIDAARKACQTFPRAAREFSEAEGLPRVAALAVREVVAAEGPTVVVTRHAVLRAPRAEVLRGLRRGDLSRLRRARANLMALFATQALSRAVRRVAEADAVCARTCRGARVAPLRVTEAARRDAAPARLRVRRVALVAVLVRGEARGDAESGAAPRRQV